MNFRDFKREWNETREKSSVNITRKDLRDWFCSEMGELSVPDCYIDAFCGRVPKSILAKLYDDYSTERLKRIYDKVDWKC
jgi:intergrase/recombinase